MLRLLYHEVSMELNGSQCQCGNPGPCWWRHLQMGRNCFCGHFLLHLWPTALTVVKSTQLSCIKRIRNISWVLTFSHSVGEAYRLLVMVKVGVECFMSKRVLTRTHKHVRVCVCIKQWVDQRWLVWCGLPLGSAAMWLGPVCRRSHWSTTTELMFETWHVHKCIHKHTYRDCTHVNTESLHYNDKVSHTGLNNALWLTAHTFTVLCTHCTSYAAEN